MTKQDEQKLIEARKNNPTAGRMTLVQMTGLGEKKVREWLKRNGGGTSGRRPAVLTPEAYKSMPSEPSPETKATSISLKDVRVSDNRPQQDQIKRRIYNLKRGVAFPVDALAEEWGVSDDRLRQNARKLECLKYVEVKPFDWVLCVMNPETAEQYNNERK